MPLPKGYKHSKKTKRKISDAHIGKKHPNSKDRFNNIINKNNIKTLEEALNCEELWNINNGITLCKKCHKKIHQITTHTTDYER